VRAPVSAPTLTLTPLPWHRAAPGASCWRRVRHRARHGVQPAIPAGADVAGGAARAARAAQPTRAAGPAARDRLAPAQAVRYGDRRSELRRERPSPDGHQPPTARASAAWQQPRRAARRPASVDEYAAGAATHARRADLRPRRCCRVAQGPQRTGPAGAAAGGAAAQVAHAAQPAPRAAVRQRRPWQRRRSRCAAAPRQARRRRRGPPSCAARMGCGSAPYLSRLVRPLGRAAPLPE